MRQRVAIIPLKKCYLILKKIEKRENLHFKIITKIDLNEKNNSMKKCPVVEKI
jgi:hypothetical protein